MRFDTSKPRLSGRAWLRKRWRRSLLAFSLFSMLSANILSLQQGALSGIGDGPFRVRGQAFAPMSGGRLPALPARGSRAARPAEGGSSDDARSYQQLSEKTLGAGLDLLSLKEELVAETWTESTLPVALLKNDGAVDIDVQKWRDGQTRTVSYKLPVLPGGIGARVENTYTVRWDSFLSVSLEIVSVTYAPVIQNMRVHTLYTIWKETADAEAKLRLEGFASWTKPPMRAFASPIERGIQKTQTGSGEAFASELRARVQP
mmetsp:Transcript_34698/g.95659  ORF Transcript_34698/g.95659 Transcript_34698/m.95659 type:complete len:260 (+) Transcript_34698:84-863(+)